ncbi:glycoside hydrolase [Rubripirellula sp.]|jgi:sialidase-1|nr:glycoside hydrolase [Rubripirellula sp.]MDF1844966.1 sialidase family protein [Rubripirellula sp.]
MKRLLILFLLSVTVLSVREIFAADNESKIQHVVIEEATKETPRSDTASIAQLGNGRLMVVYHKYEGGVRGGHDHGTCRIWSKVSDDDGKTWGQTRMLVDVANGDMNVQAPALLQTKSGHLLLITLRAHADGNSSTMCLFSSEDNGNTFVPLEPLWRRSKGQLLQGGTSSLLQLKSGRLLLPFHGGKGDQWRQKNSVWCMYSDNRGRSWERSPAIDLPKRGAMEASVAQFDDGNLLMSLRTQLGGPFLSRSNDEGMTWSEPVFSGLEGGESGTCLRRLPDSEDVVLFFNNSKYEPEHHHFGERTPLTCARSADQGKTWTIIGNIAADPTAEYTNLDCFFRPNGDAILTYMYAKPAWNRDKIQLNAARIPLDWFDGQ